MPPLIGVQLPFVAYLLIFGAIRRTGCEWRRAFLFAATIWGVFLALATELLSLPHLLTREGVTISWLVFIGLSAIWWRSARIPASASTPTTTADQSLIKTLDSAGILVLVSMCGLIALVGITAIVSPPNTGDVTFYHMPRVVMWISNRSVRFYPTLNYGHLIYAPWAEYAILNLDLLFGGDRFANMVQWFAYTGSCVAVSLIAKSLGANLRGQLWAAVACASIPTALLEASGAKNDCVVTFWITSAVYFLLEFGKDADRFDFLAFGGATALAVFTKGTAYPLLPPVLAAGWWIAKPNAKRLFIIRLPAAVALLLAINGPLYVRNYQMTGIASGIGFGDLDESREFANRNHSPAGIAANVVRNLAIQITLNDKSNSAIQRASSRIIRTLGQNPDDSQAIKLTQTMGLRFQTNELSAREDMMGAPVHIALFILGLIVVVRHWRQMPSLGWYTIGVIGSFVLFCALLKWERWNVRYQLPVLVLEAVVIGIVAGQYFERLGPLLGVLLLGTATPFALRNELRPLLPIKVSKHPPIIQWSNDSILTRSRSELYFVDLREDLRQPYISAAEEVQKQGCHSVGLDISFEDHDYLFLAFLNVNADRPRVWYSGVYNLTSENGELQHPRACAVVCFACARNQAKMAQYRSVGGRVSIFGDIAVFSAAGQLPNGEEGAPPDESKLDLPELSKLMQQRLETLKTTNSRKQYVRVLRDADEMERRTPDIAHDLTVRLESINETNNDAYMTMFNTTRLRREAESNKPMSLKEREALIAGAIELNVLITEKTERLDGLKDFEDGLRRPRAEEVHRDGSPIVTRRESLVPERSAENP